MDKDRITEAEIPTKKQNYFCNCNFYFEIRKQTFLDEQNPIKLGCINMHFT